MALLRKCYAKLRLKVNETKSAVASVGGAEVLGHSFWLRQGVRQAQGGGQADGDVQATDQATHLRTGGTAWRAVIERLKPYLLGWKAYFGLAQHCESGARWTSGCVTAYGLISSGTGGEAAR